MKPEDLFIGMGNPGQRFPSVSSPSSVEFREAFVSVRVSAAASDGNSMRRSFRISIADPGQAIENIRVFQNRIYFDVVGEMELADLGKALVRAGEHLLKNGGGT